jgi:mRNA interferase RelE/StbE
MSSPNVDFLQKKLNDYVYPQIKNQPFWGNNIKKLQGYSPDTWRYRIGKFRLFYVVDQGERIISILTVDFRKDVYR